MAKYVARRLGLMVVALVGVTLISFLIAHAVPSEIVEPRRWRRAA
jgi:ABC-type dipeptide/oligopeptide/nickel transport system permease component